MEGTIGLMKQERKLKTIQVSYGIAQGDLDTKVRQAREHLDKGCRVKFEMRMKGRQNAHPDIALGKMSDIIEGLKEPRIVVEKHPVLNGKIVEAMLVAKQKV